MLDQMPALKLKQLQHESNTWKRSLGFMMDENIHLKNRISEILKDGSDKNLLVELEGYQSRLITEDERVRLLRNELAEMDSLLLRRVIEDEKMISDLGKRSNRLRNNIIAAEKQFSRLKLGFNSRLSEYF